MATRSIVPPASNANAKLSSPTSRSPSVLAKKTFARFGSVVVTNATMGRDFNMACLTVRPLISLEHTPNRTARGTQAALGLVWAQPSLVHDDGGFDVPLCPPQ